MLHYSILSDNQAFGLLAFLTLLSTSGIFIAVESKPAIEKFMKDCFQERAIALKRRSEISQVFRQRFYAKECSVNSHHEVMAERSEVKTIVDISPLETGVGVVTTGADVNRLRLRYYLKPNGETWLIHEVDKECGYCRFQGVTPRCSYCKGSGWLHRKRSGAFKFLRGEKRTDGVISRSPEGIPQTGLVHNPAVQQFMAEYFRESSELQKKQSEIRENYTRRFYSPDGDWAEQQSFASVRQAETVEAVAPTDTGFHVFTYGLHKFWVRYDLRPAGPGWLIRELDLECPSCFWNGRKPDCSLCHGTIWDQRKIRAERQRRGPPYDKLPPEPPRWQP